MISDSFCAFFFSSILLINSILSLPLNCTNYSSPWGNHRSTINTVLSSLIIITIRFQPLLSPIYCYPLSYLHFFSTYFSVFLTCASLHLLYFNHFSLIYVSNLLILSSSLQSFLLPLPHVLSVFHLCYVCCSFLFLGLNTDL